ncbi:MAG: diguanylate cyclase domain-containing protein [Lachnospirales bacterium]
MQRREKLHSTSYIIFFFIIIFLTILVYLNINKSDEKSIDEITYANINTYYLNEIKSYDFSENLNYYKNDLNLFTKDSPLKIGVEYDNLYYFNKDNNIYGLNFFIINIFQELFNINIDIEELNGNLENYDIILTSNPTKYNLENFTKNDISVNNNLYLYGKNYFEDNSNFLINSTVYIPKEFEDILSEYFYNIQETTKFNAVFVDESFDYLNIQEKNAYFINTEIYGLTNNLPNYVKIPYSLIEYREKIYFNRNLSNNFIDFYNKIFNSEIIVTIINKYYYSILQLELKENSYFTNTEIDLIINSKTSPLLFENLQNYTPIDTYDKKNMQWNGPLLSLWNQIENLSGLNYTLTYRDDKTVDEFKKDFASNPSKTDGTLTLITANKENDILNLLNLGYTSPLILVGETIDTSSNNLNYFWGKKIGINSIYNIDNELSDLYNGIELKYFNSIYDSIAALENCEIDLIATTYEEYQNLFYRDNLYNLEVKKITPLNLAFTSGIAKNVSYSNELYSIVSKTLLTINSDELFSKTMLNNENLLMKTYNFEEQIKLLLIVCCIILAYGIFSTFYSLKIRLKFKKANATLSVMENIAFEDSLTSIKNNIAFTKDIENELLKGTFFVININDFRRIDLNYSHQTGNFVLKSIAYSLLSFSIENDMYLYRVGNDTFTLVSSTPLKINDIKNLSKKLFTLLNKPIELRENKEKIDITIRIGVSSYENQVKLEDCYYKAESASIDAKKLIKENKEPLVIN